MEAYNAEQADTYMEYLENRIVEQKNMLRWLYNAISNGEDIKAGEVYEGKRVIFSKNVVEDLRRFNV